MQAGGQKRGAEIKMRVEQAGLCSQRGLETGYSFDNLSRRPLGEADIDGESGRHVRMAGLQVVPQVDCRVSAPGSVQENRLAVHDCGIAREGLFQPGVEDRKSTRLNSSH